ncbi:MAG TPA: protein phosphatase 2C domain-containing protein [Pseudonocardiaceae bacterium]|nr:protein phosphatase 2C domain-containing protein [Pseudonocardiaceae bacterium]
MTPPVPETAPNPIAPETWTGAFEPYVVGSAGRAASRVQPRFVPRFAQRPDTVLDGVVVNGPDDAVSVTVRAASVRGLSHRAYATVRQDEYALRVTPDHHYLVLCVADGVSSGRYSHYAASWGAQDGADELVQRLANAAPDDLDWPDFLGWLARLIVEYAARWVDDLPPEPVAVAREMATVLTFAIVELGPAHTVHLLTVGDTSGWIIGADGHWHPLQPVKNAGADIYSSSVAALPLLPSVLPEPVRTELRPGETLALMTDGIGDPLGDGSGAVGRFLAESWREPPADLAFAAQVGFARSSFDDDRTAIAVWPH